MKKEKAQKGGKMARRKKKQDFSWYPLDWIEAFTSWRPYEAGEKVGKAAIKRQPQPQLTPQQKKKTPKIVSPSRIKREAKRDPHEHLMRGESVEVGGKTYFEYKGEWVPSRTKDPNPWQRNLDVIAWEKSQAPYRRAGYKSYADYAEAESNARISRVLSKALRSRGLNATVSKWDFYTSAEQGRLSKTYSTRGMKYPEGKYARSLKRVYKSITTKKPIMYWINRFWSNLAPRTKVLYVTKKMDLIGERNYKKLEKRDKDTIYNYWGIFTKGAQRNIQRCFDRPVIEGTAKAYYFREVEKRTKRPIQPPRGTTGQRRRTTTPTTTQRRKPAPTIHPRPKYTLRK